jgi:hypothetical protein
MRPDPLRTLLTVFFAVLLFGIVVIGSASAYVLTITAGPNGHTLPLPGSYTYDPGVSVPISATASPGYHIDKELLDSTLKYQNGPTYTFSVKMDSDHQLVVTFAPDTGSLYVISTPRNAEIFIDGEDTGRQTPDTVELSVGNHNLKLVLDGYQDYTMMISITAGQTTAISQQLYLATPIPTATQTAVPTTTTVKTTSPTPTATTVKTTSPTPTATTTVHTTVTTTIPTTSPIATITTSVVPQTEVTTEPTTYPIEILPTPTTRPSLPTTTPITTVTTGSTIMPTITTSPDETQVVNNSSVIALVPTVVATASPLVAPTNNSSAIPVGPQIPPYFTASNIAFFLLIMVIPLGLLLSHDYMGLGYLSFPQAPLVRAAVALGQGICVFGLFYIQRSLMDLIPGLGDPTLLPLVLIIMLFVAYLTFSAIALAVGSVLSRPLRWTLKVHVIIGVVVLVLAPLILFWLTDGNWRIILAAIVIAPITAMLALWQNHSLTMHFRKGGFPWEGFLDREETTVPALTDTHFRTIASRPDSFPPELADRYTSIEFLGKGGLAHVYRARRLKDGKTVAVKIPIRFDETTGKCFMKEIVAWEGLRHPNIVEITEVNILPLPYVEMEFVRSGLADLKTPIRIPKAVEIIMGVAKGLAYAHEQGIIHRDIKPHNILITKDGVPKITDWGMSRLMGSSAAPTVTGFSLAYASPEQVAPGKFGETDERTDIYQLGVVFYELVTGKPLFPGDNLPEVSNAVLSQVPVPPSLIDPRLKDLEPIILKCLEKEQKDRYQTIHELIDALTDYMNRGTLPVPEEEQEHSGEGEF